MVLDISKQQFVSNSNNKQSLVDYVKLKLTDIEGIQCVSPRSDADCLIVDCNDRTDRMCVTVVGDDTDLIVLLLQRTPQQDACAWSRKAVLADQ